MKLHALSLILTLVVHDTIALSSPLAPFTNYTYSTELKADVADLWWTVDAALEEITFELHIKTTGWIALGISPGLYALFSIIHSNPLMMFSWWHDRRRHWSGVDRSNRQTILRGTTLPSVFSPYHPLIIRRIDTPLASRNQWSTTPRSTGLDFKVVKKTDGQPSSSSARSTPVTSWTSQSKFVSPSPTSSLRSVPIEI